MVTYMHSVYLSVYTYEQIYSTLCSGIKTASKQQAILETADLWAKPPVLLRASERR